VANVGTTDSTKQAQDAAYEAYRTQIWLSL
jgi:hypothetical protein